jgi:hypothetical protein
VNQSNGNSVNAMFDPARSVIASHRSAPVRMRRPSLPIGKFTRSKKTTTNNDGTSVTSFTYNHKRLLLRFTDGWSASGPSNNGYATTLKQQSMKMKYYGKPADDTFSPILQVR